jgi:hypothetical protein
MHVINKAEDYLEDVHTFLRLPKLGPGPVTGANYSVALVLFGVIDGTAKTIYPIDAKPNQNDPGKTDPVFVTLLEEKYPWDEDPETDAVKDRLGAEAIYYCYRNPLVHALAAEVPADPQYQRARVYKVEKWGGLSEEVIENLEASESRPHIGKSILSATVRYRRSDDTMLILMEALYRGARIMIERLTHDSSIMRTAESRRPRSQDYKR